MSNNFDVVVPHEDKKLGSLREYRDKSEIGFQIKRDLLTKYIKEDQRSKEGFYLGYREEFVGLLSQCYGVESLLLLMNAYNVEMTPEEKQLIVKTIESILVHVDEHGYDMDPFIESKDTSQLFGKKKYRYTDSITWVLSVITQARFAYKNNYLTFSTELNKRLAEIARDILIFLIETVIGGENNPQGWGYINGCTSPSIYFTYTVTESFNDFEDYILGNEDINTIKDNEFLEQINIGLSPDELLHNRMANIKGKLGSAIWEKFKNVLHTEFMSDTGTIITRDQIRNSTRTSALFSTIYIVCTLIYCETDKLPEYIDNDRIQTLIGQALQMVSNFYDVLKSDGLDNIVDKHLVSFDQPHTEKRLINKIISSASIYLTTLTPMLLKANSLLTFYVTQFPEREMSRYFDIAIKKRVNNGEHWLWEEGKYDLATTERYVEAILDFYDYYEKFEQTYLKSQLGVIEEEQKIELRLRQDLLPKLREQVTEELRRSHENDLFDLRKEITNEFQLEELINKKIEKAIQEQTIIIIERMFEEITAINKGEVSGTDEDLPFDLSDLFMSVIKSYFYKFTYEALKIDDEIFTKDELVHEFEEDFEQFIQAWFSYLVTYGGKHGMRWFFRNNERDDSKYLRNRELN